MKYRIKETKLKNGIVTYIPQRRFLWFFWESFRRISRFSSPGNIISFPIECNSLAQAKEHIQEEIDFRKSEQDEIKGSKVDTKTYHYLDNKTQK